VADEVLEAGLVERARAGDQAAFAALITRYQQPLGGYLAHLTGDRELAADLAQETFLRAYRALGATRPDLLIRPWLYRIATNLAYDFLRRRRRLAWLPLDAAAHHVLGDPVTELAELHLVRDLAGRGQTDGRHGPLQSVTRADTRRRDGRSAASPRVGHHPPPEHVEAVAYGWLAGPAAQPVRAHAASCPACSHRLRADEELHQQLTLRAAASRASTSSPACWRSCRVIQASPRGTGPTTARRGASRQPATSASSGLVRPRAARTLYLIGGAGPRSESGRWRGRKTAMHEVPVLTVSAIVVALAQLVRWAGLPDRWAPVAVAVLALVGVGFWAAAGPDPSTTAFDYFAAWVTVTTSAAGVFGFTRAGFRARRSHPPGTCRRRGIDDTADLGSRTARP
jgi:DNA-directed RNA polymerase specialized sigma24 family protein